MGVETNSPNPALNRVGRRKRRRKHRRREFEWTEDGVQRIEERRPLQGRLHVISPTHVLGHPLQFSAETSVVPASDHTSTGYPPSYTTTNNDNNDTPSCHQHQLTTFTQPYHLSYRPTSCLLDMAGGAAHGKPVWKGNHPVGQINAARPLYRIAATGLGASMWFFVCPHGD